MSRLIAIDPSLTCSGWALFSIADGALVGVGKVRPLPPSMPLAARLDDLQRKISLLFEHLSILENDVLVCEAPTTMRDPRAALKVEQVRSIFETLGRERGLAVPGRLNPRTVQYEVMGLGGRQLKREQVKAVAVQTVVRLYGPVLARIGFADEREALARHQDIVDAILVGTLALSRIQSAHRARIPLEDLFAERPQQRRVRMRAA